MVRAFAALFLGFAMLAGSVIPSLAQQAVRVTVNGEPITDAQVSGRAKLFALERRGGGTQAAAAELVDETIMLQEAKRIGLTINETQVDNALQNVARNLKISQDKLVQLLNANGVPVDTLKARLRASIAWNEVTSMVVRPRVQISEVELEQKAEGQLTAAMSYDYVLKEVIFIGGNASARTAQANQYRKSFQGCDSAVQLSTSYTDAAVVDVGRRHATQMPEAIAKELSGLGVGGITKPRVVEKGVSMLAVCSKAAAKDLTFLTGDLRQEVGTEALKKEAEVYLKELKDKARVVYN